jgi:hypothetical protein
MNILVEEPEGKITLGRTRHKLEDNIRMDPSEIKWEVMTGFILLMIGTSDRSF